MKNRLSFVDRLIGTFLLGLTQIIATQMLLGAVFKQLYASPLYFLNVFLSILILYFSLRNNGGRGLCSEIKDEFAGIFRIIYGDNILLIIFSLFSVSVCWLVFLGYLFPSYSWDALYYHLPIVGQIMQSGAIQENSNPSFIQQYINIFSKNINLFFLWNVIFLKSDVIVDLSQLCFTITGVLSIFSMAVKLKIRKQYALYCALLFFFTPVIILQSTINYVDGAVSMLFLIAVNYLICDDRTNNSSKARTFSLLLSGLAAGILLGSKPTGPVFIVVMLGVLAVHYFAGRFIRLSHNWKDSIVVPKWDWKTLCLYFCVPVLLTGGFWYIRNWIVHGNPVYYIDVSLFGMNVFKGMKSDWVESAPEVIASLNYFTSMLHVWLEKVEYYMYDSRLSGFGPIWFIIFLPAILFSLIRAVVQKHYGFLFISSILLITFIIHPRNWTTRYVMFIVGFGSISFGLVFEHFHNRARVIRVTALLLATYTFLTANSPCIMPGQIKEFLDMPAHERTLSKHKPFNIDSKVYQEYGYWIWIENNISKGDTLAYTFEAFNLDTSKPFFTAKLWNREFSNKVAYVKSDKYKEWLKDLNSHNASYILTKNGSVEDRWIEKERKLFYSLRWMGKMKEKFKVVYSDNVYKIVEYIKNSK
jgi:hypothetical protein